MANSGAPGATASRPWRRLVGPAFVTLAMLAVLIALGNWQLRRLAWKTALLADIAHAEAAPAIPLPTAPAPFEKVSAAGVWQPDLAILYGDEVQDGPAGPVIGAQLVVPLRLADGANLLVDRGWVPAAQWRTLAAATSGAAKVTGYLHLPEHAALFSARDDPRDRRFYTLDPEAIASALALPHIMPYALVALGPPGATPPVPATSLPRPPNDHLQYALTWYGLAATLVGVFSAWSWRQFASPAIQPGG